MKKTIEVNTMITINNDNINYNNNITIINYK